MREVPLYAHAFYHRALSQGPGRDLFGGKSGPIATSGIGVFRMEEYLARKEDSLPGPYRRPMPIALRWSQGVASYLWNNIRSSQLAGTPADFYAPLDTFVKASSLRTRHTLEPLAWH